MIHLQEAKLCVCPKCDERRERFSMNWDRIAQKEAEAMNLTDFNEREEEQDRYEAEVFEASHEEL